MDTVRTQQEAGYRELGKDHEVPSNGLVDPDRTSYDISIWVRSGLLCREFTPFHHFLDKRVVGRHLSKVTTDQGVAATVADVDDSHRERVGVPHYERTYER